jgi:hypothetical protein
VTLKRAPQIGDVFAVRRPVSAEGLLGRVVSTSAIVGPTHGCNLVYLYRLGSTFSRDELLLPPMMTTRAPWSRRYFDFVRSEPLLPGDFFEQHCFRDARGRLFDEKSRPLESPVVPVGPWRLYEEVEAIEAAIARAERGS